jgi:hypothetical protein
MADTQRARIDRLFLGLANEVGDDTLKLSDEGQLFCTLNGVRLSFLHAAQRPTLFILGFAGNLGSLAPESQAEILGEALDANNLWQGSAGGIFGLDENGNLLLSYRLDLPEDLEGEGLEALLPALLPPFIGAAGWAQDRFSAALGQLDPEA